MLCATLSKALVYKVHHNNIVLVTFVHVQGYVMHTFNKLAFTSVYFTKPMLKRIENAMTIQMSREVTAHNMCSKSLQHKLEKLQQRLINLS